MPNRILKESICTSEEIDKLSLFEEVCFYRLLVNCDDFGRLDARPKVLVSKLFPLRDVRTEQIESALLSLASAGLVSLYEVGGKPFMQIVTWGRHQQTRATKSKYPAPDGSYNHLISSDINCNQVISDDNNGNQAISDDNNGNQRISSDNKCSRTRTRNRNRDREEDARAREESSPAPFISEEDAFRQQEEQNEVLDALRSAGFPANEKSIGKYLDLLNEHGKEKLLEAVDICVDHSVSKLDYLRAVLEGMEKPKKTRDPYDDMPLFTA